MLILHTLFFCSLAIWLYMTAWFSIAVLIKRNDVADIAWGPGFLCVGIVALIVNHNTSGVALLVTLLVAIWGLRLSLHIGLRNRKKSEDFRYKAWRDSWGQWFYVRSYLQVFITQGALLLIISLPVLITNTDLKTAFGPLVVLGCLVWIVGFGFESIADKQLSNFRYKQQNKGKIINQGLWKYSRHPNYFGEVTQWWGIGIIALTSNYGWLGLLGPAVITVLIIKVSGVPILERKYQDNPAYQAYKQRTSMLVPLPPRDVRDFPK